MGAYERTLKVGGVTEEQVAAVVAVLDDLPEFDGEDEWACGYTGDTSSYLPEYPVALDVEGNRDNKTLVEQYLARARTMLTEAHPGVRFLTESDLARYETGVGSSVA